MNRHERSRFRSSRPDEAWPGLSPLAPASNRRRAIRARSARFHYHEGLTRLGSGDLRGAIDALRDSLTLDPSSSDAWFRLGNALVALRDPTAATRAYRQALELEPRRFRLWFSMAHALLNLLEG